ncbi:hypothetical protein SLEP1_g59988 [Rubroshorea leprosula]|uniref:Uncharacterized protein n=1 Tax=Rubroshorea leprosula TaxID=152421 RepID=A0AAV5MU02_9ROSI|nr:hypothetical protein SLEP1_g59988 [Rubroshorea leprosula]
MLLVKKIKAMLFEKSVHFLFSGLGWGWRGAALFLAVKNVLEWVYPIIENNLTLYVGSDGASSSKRPPLDLNFPPADEMEPDSTSEPNDQGALPLSIAELRTLHRLGGSVEAPDSQLLREARAIVQLKGAIADRMYQLDRERPEFWREKRDAIIQDSILTNRQKEYSSRKLEQKLEQLMRSDAERTATYRSISKIRKKFFELQFEFSFKKK